MVYHIALLIFNMVSEPNFVLGIKQTSLANKEDSHVYPTSSLHRASALSLREGVRDILDILAQCNRPKPSPTSNSNLGFNRLYILMLGFIITQVIVPHSYTIKMQPLRDASVDVG